MSAPVESLLRRDRWLVAGGLVLVAGLAWAWLLAGAGMDMTAFEMTRHSQMDMPWTQPAPWSAGYAVLMFSMWWVMMAAMMLPSATPVILLAAALNRRAEPGSMPFGGAAWFALGYLLAWAGFSAAAVLVQWLLQRQGLLSGMLVSHSTLFSAVVLGIAGLWQFLPWKQACLRQCRAPAGFLAAHRRPGRRGALRMGAHHGLYCQGCCWFLMGLLFVGGVMNLWWIIGLTVYVWVEKALPGGRHAASIMGGALLAWGLALLVTG